MFWPEARWFCFLAIPRWFAPRAMRPARPWREVPGLAAPRFPRLLYPLSRDRVAACFATPCPGHAAFAGRTTRRRMAQRHPRRGWLRSAPPTACSSHCCGGGCGCPCLSHRTDVAHTATGAALTLTPTVTTMPRAPERGCSPHELSPSSTHGCASHARLLDRKAKSCHNSGWRARPPLA